MSATEGTEESFQRDAAAAGRWPHCMADGGNGSRYDFDVVQAWWTSALEQPKLYRFRRGSETTSAVVRARAILLGPKECFYNNVAEQIKRFGAVYCELHGGILDDHRRFRAAESDPPNCSMATLPIVPLPAYAFIILPRKEEPREESKPEPDPESDLEGPQRTQSTQRSDPETKPDREGPQRTQSTRSSDPEPEPEEPRKVEAPRQDPRGLSDLLDKLAALHDALSKKDEIDVEIAVLDARMFAKKLLGRSLGSSRSVVGCVWNALRFTPQAKLSVNGIEVLVAYVLASTQGTLPVGYVDGMVQDILQEGLELSESRKP